MKLKTNTHNNAEEKKKLRAAMKGFATLRIEKVFEHSNIKDNSANFPQFDLEEVTLGKVLGKGGFGTVYEIRGFAIKDAHYDETAPNEEVAPGAMESREFMVKHCIRQGGDARYTLKILSPYAMDDPTLYLQGVIDMAVESRILSDLDHPNIIHVRACAKVSPVEEGYFLVMDRLYDTMGSRMDKWAATNRRLAGIGGKLLDCRGTKKKELLEEKLVVALDVCAAIEYLHSKRILYRDLKPDNVGFDIRDDVKIFDMGLAKELTDIYKPDKDGLYKLTGMTGCPRYMAPEVGNDQPYNMSCDTYSFGIMFWQMYSDMVPFELYSMSSFKVLVWSGEQKRPFVQESWPVPIKSLLQRAWSTDIHERPTFAQISTVLKNECARIKGGKADGLEHALGRSTFAFRGTHCTPVSNVKNCALEATNCTT